MAYTDRSQSMGVYEHQPTLKYPPLKPGETRKRKIAGVTVIQRHDWSEIRYREIKASLEFRPVKYDRGSNVTPFEPPPNLYYYES